MIYAHIPMNKCHAPKAVQSACKNFSVSFEITPIRDQSPDQAASTPAKSTKLTLPASQMVVSPRQMRLLFSTAQMAIFVQQLIGLLGRSPWMILLETKGCMAIGSVTGSSLALQTLTADLCFVHCFAEARGAQGPDDSTAHLI